MSFHDDELANSGAAAEPIFFKRPASEATDYKSGGVYAGSVKRALDLLFVLLASPFIVTFVGLSALIIALDGHNPFYTQLRVGKDGRTFKIYKLRSMVPNADALLRAHLEADPAARKEWIQSQKLRCDPRVTRFGRLIRKFSIDELPQFLNVLIGDMSVVGPRPFMVNQRPVYSGRAYYDMRPGLTGLWQISTRNEAEFAARVRYDDLYARTLSFGGDLRIMLKTAMVMLRGTGC